MQSVITLSPSAIAWLNCSDSLTDRVHRWCETVQVQLLNNTATDQGLLREINMLCDYTPWWYAKTQVPYATYRLRQSQFDQLGLKPLASMLYTDPQIQRRQLTLDCIHHTHSEYQSLHETLGDLVADMATLWVRRSIFTIEDKPFYLLEVLLPPLLQALNQCSTKCGK